MAPSINVEAPFLLCLLVVAATYGCPEDFKEINGGCYRFVETWKNWGSSQRDCADHNASLVVIESKEEEEGIERYIEQHYQTKFGWRMGLYKDKEAHCHPREPKDCTWKWSLKGQPARALGSGDYSRNNQSEPIINYPTGTLHKHNGLWRWSGNWWGSGAPYICELYSEPKPTTPIPTTIKPTTPFLSTLKSTNKPATEVTDEAPLDPAIEIKTTMATKEDKSQETPTIASQNDELINEDRPETKPLEEEKPAVKPSLDDTSRPLKPFPCLWH